MEDSQRFSYSSYSPMAFLSTVVRDIKKGCISLFGKDIYSSMLLVERHSSGSVRFS